MLISSPVSTVLTYWTSEKSVNAVVLDKDTPWFVKVAPPAVYADFADVSYTSASFTANGALIYNTTTDGGSGTTDAVVVIAFGGDKTATNGTFTIQFPAADASNAILRIS